jgi:triacylglycerol esterase/lipase EstA (alpha/beta hydrolase family)
MIKRILIVLLLVQAGAVLALAWAAVRYAHLAPLPALACGAALLLLLRLAITANNFSLSWRARSPTPAAHQLAPAARLRLFWREFRASMLTSSWSMLWPVGLQMQATPRGLPVLLIHGYGCNGGYWRQLSARLRAAGISHYAIDLEPPTADIDDYVPQVQAASERLRAASGAERIVIVAHSMGGLVARAWLRRHGGAHLARLVTLGTPHHGTALARLGMGHNARQMRRGHGWLPALSEAEPDARRAAITSIFSHHDNIVAPQESCRLPGARNLEFGGIGHVELGRSGLVLDAVMAEIKAVSMQQSAIDLERELR